MDYQLQLNITWQNMSLVMIYNINLQQSRYNSSSNEGLLMTTILTPLSHNFFIGPIEIYSSDSFSICEVGFAFPRIIGHRLDDSWVLQLDLVHGFTSQVQLIKDSSTFSSSK